MVNGIGGSGTRAAIDAALKGMRDRANEIGARPSGSEDATVTGKATDFAAALKEGLGTVETTVNRTNEIHLDVVQGNLDIHEVAAQLKESEITFQFALTVRNKLIDAYREVMRMSV